MTGWTQYKKKPLVVWAALLQEDTYVETLEGRMLGRKGDYLIRGVKGELYPCKPDVFEETYEPVPPMRTFEAEVVNFNESPAHWPPTLEETEGARKKQRASQNGVFCDKSPGGKA